MAAFTITTGTAASPTNIDTLVGRTGADTFTINGGFLLIDEDSRYGLNATTSTTMAGITPSSSLGGSVLVDGRAIWLIPYTGGSGNVPAYNTAITKGSASGKLIGVHSALNAAPTTPGTAMPATGYIRVKQWNGTLYGTGALTGIAATAAAGETVGWIVPVGQEGSATLIGALNQTPSGSYDGSFVKGDWYTVGTTDGNRATSYQIPTNGEAVWHGGVMVDKAAATTITAASWSAGVATFTSTAHGLTTDDRVFVGVDILPRAWRTVDTQRCTVIDANTFTVPMTTNPGAYVSGGKVAAQEWWPITDSLNTKVGSETHRGQFAWLDSATGLLRFGNDNITSTGGICPSTGRVIRLPNVMSANATSAAKTVNSLNATIGQRWRFYGGNAGTVKADHLAGSWSPSVFQTGKSVTLADCAIVNQISISTQAAPSFITNCCTGGNGSTTVGNALLLASYQPTTVVDSVFSTGEIAGRIPMSFGTNYGASFDRCRFVGTGDRTSASYSVNANIGNGATFTRCQFGGFGLITASQYSNISMSNCSYYSAPYGINIITLPTATINLTNLSVNCSFTDFTLPGTNPLARNSLLTAAAGSNNTLVRNWGTLASPIDMRLNGTQFWKPWTRVTTTATVTENGHPYRVGDQCMVINSSNTTTITVGVKTITAVTANTFDFACVNSGPASGTVSYYVSGLLSLFTTTGTSGTKIQNVHVRGQHQNPTSTGNTQYGMTLDNVTSEPHAYVQVPTSAANNYQPRSLFATDYPIISTQTAVFGTHFADLFLREPGTAVPGQSAAVTGVSWTRTTTTCTVTSPNHGIIGNNQRIFVENSSSPAAVPNGWGSSGLTLVPLDKDTFFFTCPNAGAASGTLDYWLGQGDSTLRVLMNEQSSSTIGQAVITASAGLAGFTGAGTLVLPAVGDQATWETPGFLLGYDGFAHAPAIPYGSAITSLANIQQFDIQYALDRGAGFGAWRNAQHHGSTGGGWGASGATTLTVTDSRGIQVDDYVVGVGVAPGAKFVSRQPGKLEMTNAATSTASTPDSAALQLTGSFTLDAKLTLANWASPLTTTGCIISKGDSSTLTKGYYLRFTSTGALTLAVGTGSAAVSATSSVSTSTVMTNGVASWVRAVWDEPADQAKFYYSSDGSSWTQLGTTQALVGAAVGTSASTFYIGQRTTGNDFLAADIYRVRVYSDATQTTKVFDADFSTNTTGAPTLTESVNSAVVTTVGCQEVTVSAANTAAVSGVLTWWYMPNEAAFPSTGVKFRVRVTANTANIGAFYQIDLPLLSSTTSRSRLYPQTTSVPLSITAVDANLAPVQNARVVIKAAAGGPTTAGTILLTGLTNASGVLTGTYGYSSSQPITGWVRKATGSPTYKQALIGGTVGTSGFSTTVFLVADE